LNKEDKDNLLNASQGSELFKHVGDFACGGDEGHIEDDTDEKNEKLEDIENSEEDACVVEDIFALAESSEDAQIYVEERDEKKEEGEIVVNTRQ
jgi:hypothetical protein